MKRITTQLAAAAGALLTLGLPMLAAAQLGMYTLPKNDFVWRWGDESRQRTTGDFEASGGEAGFQCELIGEIHPGSRLTPSEVREFENGLRTRMDFIYAAATSMNQLDFSNDLDWAVLTCARPKATPATEEEKAENEARAKEKMQREIERRRARQQRDAD
jgi:hypothetical protein